MWGLHKLIHIKLSTLCLAYSKVKVKVTQSCQTLCKLKDYTAHGILQARRMNSHMIINLQFKLFPPLYLVLIFYCWKKKKPVVLRSLTQCHFIISQLHREDIWYCMARFSTPAKIKILASCVLIWSSGTSFKFISVMSRIQLFSGHRTEVPITCYLLVQSILSF